MMPNTVFVFGSINVDSSHHVAAIPQPGETVIASDVSTSPGGKGANQAIAAASAGAITRMIGAVGDDLDSTMVLEELAARGVDTDLIVTLRSTTTGRAIVCVDDSGENSIVVVSGANAHLNELIAETGLATISAGDILVLQNEVPAAANFAAARLAKSAGAIVIWNAAPSPMSAAELVHDLDLLIVNEHELKRVGAVLEVAHGDEGSSSELGELLTAVSRKLRTDAICTLGSEGLIFTIGAQHGSVPAPKAQPRDTTGAGDAFVGYLASQPALPWVDRLQLAAAAGAITVTQTGASTSIPQLEAVESMLATLTEKRLV
ncbi:ribokinase [Salinibacterium sp. M195]|uniref:ribokinase n=1 Tax=Salinibacterium sp. M195 TaxID=2583374 RepID=UPI001C635C7B|nr:ribokinase [Salinibacterium sp. M195]QYH34665.1 ribokinase [Salinibacterium sp. M195]